MVPTGSARVIEFIADNPGDWIFHCHMTHHMMNQMGHDLPNMLGVHLNKELFDKIADLIPGFIPLEGAHHSRIIPKNCISMLSYEGQFGQTMIGGMSNLLRVRANLKTYDDPGPYQFPSEQSALSVELKSN